jgi:hypothetical protein
MKVHIFAKKGSGRVHAEFFHFLPLQVLVCYSSPASSADWRSFSFEKDINFYIIVLAFSVPWILTMLHQRLPPFIGTFKCFAIFGF